MNFRILCCIVMGVFTAHLGALMLWTHLRPKPKFTPPPKPNFSSYSRVVEVDAATGERTIEREITVSTKFAVPRPEAVSSNSPPSHQPSPADDRGVASND